MSSVLMELNTTSATLATDSFGSDIEACDGGPISNQVTGYFISSFANGAQLFTDSACTTNWDTVHGEGWFYNASANQSFFYSRWTPTGGGVSDITSC